ncbi:MAG: hypothetical protein JEZ03_16655 [Bacteroidales bacterium]|nr:hypothetical protein [Bacteroidales bacterium]
MFKKYFLITILVTLLISCNKPTINEEPAKKQYEWQYFKTKDGLAANMVYDIAIDKDNTKWFATEFGVSRFNDQTFTNFTQSSGLLDHKINCIAVDLNNEIWCGSDLGLNRYDGSLWTTYTFENGLVNNHIYDIAVDGLNNIWIATAEGVSKYNRIEFVNYQKQGDQSLVNNKVRAISVSPDNTIWFGTEFGISSLNTQNEWFTYINPNNSNAFNLSALAVSNTQIWFGTLNGACAYTNGSWHTFSIDQGLVWPIVQDISLDKLGYIWFATRKGISWYDGNDFHSITTQDLLSDDYVNAIQIDQNGAIWIATNSEGLCKLIVLSQQEKSE